MEFPEVAGRVIGVEAGWNRLQDTVLWPPPTLDHIHVSPKSLSDPWAVEGRNGVWAGEDPHEPFKAKIQGDELLRGSNLTTYRCLLAASDMMCRFRDFIARPFSCQDFHNL